MEKTDNPKCEKCKSRTAFIKGYFYYVQDPEPYMAGIREEAVNSEGETSISGFICDKCGNIQNLIEE